MKRIGLPASFCRRKGSASPAKLLPPPTQPTTTSGESPAIAICFSASRPITVWCSRTWLSTLPSVYFESLPVTAASTASLMAIPRLPGQFGSAARIWRPALVSWEGLGVTSAPHIRIIERRYGFWS